VAVTGDGDRPNFRRGLQLATRSAVSATLAFSIAQALKLDYPIFALAAAVIATDLTPARSRELGFRRLVATAIGGLSGALAASMNLVGIWAVGPSILIAMLICQGVGAYEGARIAATSAASSFSWTMATALGGTRIFGRSRPRSASSWRGV